jgi:hypothetical protein
MKKIILSSLILIANTICFAQKDYTEYYNITYNYHLNSPNPEKVCDINKKEVLFLKAFSINDPLANDLFDLADGFYNSGNTKKGEEYLMKAANAGFERSDLEYYFFIDSLLKSDKKLKEKFEKNYSDFLKNRCDITNSIKIIKLFDSDQLLRIHFSKYYQIDTTNKKSIMKEWIKDDSLNYFSLIEIMKSPGFNSSNLTNEAKLGIGIILTHSATNHYTNPDTVFALLKKEMLKGVVDPRFYTNSVDRYYMNNKELNYYCNFYDESLPIIDIENVDKRRAEVWLYPLYLKFKWNKQLEKLPKEYKYDVNTIGKE